MSAKIEAGKGWIIEKHGDFHKEKDGVLLPSGLLVASPVYMNGHQNLLVRLYNSGSIVEVWSNTTHSVVKGNLPWNPGVEGQVLYSSLSQKYGKSIFILIGLDAIVAWNETNSEKYLRVKNLIDISGSQL